MIPTQKEVRDFLDSGDHKQLIPPSPEEARKEFETTFADRKACFDEFDKLNNEHTAWHKGLAGIMAFAMQNGLRASATSYLESHGIPVKAPTKAEQMRSLENTGTCPVCMQNIKLTSSKGIMRHGWSEVGGRKQGEYGNVFHSGSCYGVGYQPWELSPKGAEDYADHLEKVIPGQEAALKKLDTDPPPFMRESRQRGWKTVVIEHEKGSYDYDRMLRNAKSNMRNTIKFLKQDLESTRARVETWKRKPLPGEKRSK